MMILIALLHSILFILPIDIRNHELDELFNVFLILKYQNASTKRFVRLPSDIPLDYLPVVHCLLPEEHFLDLQTPGLFE